MIISKLKESAEAVKLILKRNIDPTSMQIGINSMKKLRDGRLVVESRSKEEIDMLGKKIEEQCSQLLEVNVPQLRNPNVIIFNVPDDITPENAVDVITTQNQELNLANDSIKPKFIMKSKGNTRHLIAEVKPETWRKIGLRKLKIGWQICNVEEYVKVNRCYKCSKFNHRAAECRGEETCPLCAEGHKLGECKAAKKDFKCTNCITYNTHNNDSTMNENHSSLDKKCPCLQQMIKKNRQNTEY